MKAKTFISILTAICLCFTLSACKEDINYSTPTGGADFTITNTTTGERVESQGLVIGTPEKLTAHPGDILKLSYTPPTEYAEYTWKVSFELFDETFTEYSPFTMEYTIKDVEPGEYVATCNGVIEEADVDFSGSDTGTIYINVVD